MESLSAVSLKNNNTLAIDCIADRLIRIDHPYELPPLIKTLRDQGQSWMVLGGGSNVVLPDRLSTPVLQIQSHNIRALQLDDTRQLVYSDAGVVWDDLVDYCVKKSLYGIENLSLIPGTVGAAPIQNIGAYGVELKDRLRWVWVWDESCRQFKLLNVSECRLAYRDSVFKRQPGRYIVMGVYLELSRVPVYSLEYGDLQSLNGKSGLSLSEVRKTVITIRQSKLPDPESIPNAGSFFKNPVLNGSEAREWQQQHSNASVYNLPDGSIKIAAAWLIEQCGWKGYRNERVGVHDRQALVMVNHGGGQQRDIAALADEIRQSVKQQFHVDLEIEPVLV